MHWFNLNCVWARMIMKFNGKCIKSVRLITWRWPNGGPTYSQSRNLCLIGSQPVKKTKHLPRNLTEPLPTVLGPVPRFGPQPRRSDSLLPRPLPTSRRPARTRGHRLRGMNVRPAGTRPTGLRPTGPSPTLPRGRWPIGLRLLLTGLRLYTGATNQLTWQGQTLLSWLMTWTP